MHLPGPASCADQTEGRPAPARREGIVRALTLGLGLVGLALLCRPYLGLSGDARVYIGRALANLDPAGVGPDLMYVGDGQSAFSLFPVALAGVVSILGAQASAALVGLAGIVVWVAAAGAVLRAWSRSLPFWLLAAAALLLPGAYSGLGIRFGEAAATPRPFAEALVLAGLWMLLKDRRIACGLLLVAATALHPIMALPGWGVMFVLEAWRRPALLLLPAGLAALVCIGGLVHAPLAGRVFEGMDRDWAAILHRTAPYLFIGEWSAATWGRTLVQTTTVVLGALFLGGRARALALAVVVVSALSLSAAAVLGDGLGSVLVLQVQAWRSLWVLAFFAAAGFPVVALGLWRLGPTGRLGAATLVAAWLSVDVPVAAIIACASLVGLYALAHRGGVLPPWASVVGWVLAVSLIVLIAGFQAMALWPLATGEAYSAPLNPHLLALLDVNRTILATGLLAAFGLFRAVRVPRVAAMATGLLCFIAGALTWDSRDAGRRVLDDRLAPPQLEALMAGRPGAVQWLEGDVQPWVWAGRPAWQSYLQSSSNVFSRAQALEWSRRTHRLVETGVGPPALLDRFPHNPSSVLWIPTETAVRDLCRDADAPGWIVVPHLRGDFAGRQDVSAIVILDRAEPMLDDRTHRVVQVSRYALLPCAGGKTG